MNHTDWPVGRPIENLQRSLRYLEDAAGQTSYLVPDGIYGAQTKAAVERFQRRFRLPVTGVADFATYTATSEAYRAEEARQTAPGEVLLFPFGVDCVLPGDTHPFLFPIQGIMRSLQPWIKQLPELTVNGVYDESWQEAVKVFQKISGLTVTGELDRTVCRSIQKIYEALISRNPIQEPAGERNLETL